MIGFWCLVFSVLGALDVILGLVLYSQTLTVRTLKSFCTCSSFAVFNRQEKSIGKDTIKAQAFFSVNIQFSFQMLFDNGNCCQE